MGHIKITVIKKTNLSVNGHKPQTKKVHLQNISR